VGSSPITFAEASRLEAEAGFRLGIAVPLAAVVVLLAIKDGNLFWLLGLFVCIMLAANGVDLRTLLQKLILSAMNQGQAPSVAVQ
jgi:hypothetical protein